MKREKQLKSYQERISIRNTYISIARRAHIRRLADARSSHVPVAFDRIDTTMFLPSIHLLHLNHKRLARI